MFRFRYGGGACSDPLLAKPHGITGARPKAAAAGGLSPRYVVPDPNDACYLPSRSSMTAANPRWLEELPLLKLERPVRMRALAFERGELVAPRCGQLHLPSLSCCCEALGASASCGVGS